MTIEDNKILDILQKFDLQFKVLILVDGRIDGEIFKNLISIFQLDKLIISRGKMLPITRKKKGRRAAGLVVNSPAPTSVVQCINLLALASPDAKAMNALTEVQVKAIKLAFRTSDTFISKNQDDFETSFACFMQHQTKLKELIIELPVSRLSLITRHSHLWTLEKLAIHHEFDGTTNFRDYKGLAKLIKSQPALKDLEICAHTISINTMKAIYQAKNLQQLKLIDVSILECSIRSLAPCAPHANLKSLIIELNLYNRLTNTKRKAMEAVLNAILMMFANVETLGVHGIDEDSEISPSNVIQYAQTHLKSLDSLMIPEIPYNLPPMIFSRLKKLRVSSMRSLKNKELQSFMQHNSSLEELKIDKIYDTETNLELPQTRGPCNLRKLSIGKTSESFKVDKDVLQVLHNSCPSLSKFAVGYDCDMFIFPDGNIVDFPLIQVVMFKFTENVLQNKFSLSSFDTDDEDLRYVGWGNGDYDDDDEFSNAYGYSLDYDDGLAHWI